MAGVTMMSDERPSFLYGGIWSGTDTVLPPDGQSHPALFIFSVLTFTHTKIFCT